MPDSMSAWIHKYWGEFIAFVLVILGYGKLQWDVRDLKKRKAITPSDCLLYRRLFELKFDQGTEKFVELHGAVDGLGSKLDTAVGALEKKIDENHKDVIDKLLLVLQGQK